jgi:hypothetical protein
MIVLAGEYQESSTAFGILTLVGLGVITVIALILSRKVENFLLSIKDRDIVQLLQFQFYSTKSYKKYQA